MSFVTFLLDAALIGLLAVGIYYATKLTRQLADMRAHHTDMARLVMDFNATVMRAETGIKGLKAAARSSGDDLEKLIERAHGLRDELHFLVESADQLANRLSDTATRAARAVADAEKENAKKAPVAESPRPAPAAKPNPFEKAVSALSAASSSAEKDLLKALKKIG